MRPSIRLVALFLVAALALPVVAASAQTPQASPGAQKCTVEPRTIEEIEALVADVEPLPAGSSMEIIDAIPTGIPADEETIAEIAATLDMFFVCAASGRLLTVAGFWSDDLIREQVAHVPEYVDFVTSPMDYAGERPRRTIATLDHVTVLDDGRVSAVITTDGFEDDVPIEDRTDLVVLVREDGMWRLDGAFSRVRLGPGETGLIPISDVLPPSTPVATPAT